MSIFDTYKTWLFDFDGVILDSNKIKTDAFGVAVQSYGSTYAQDLIDYHVAHGGISRFVKFSYFFTDLLGREPKEGEMDQVLDNFAQAVHQGLLSCAQTPDLKSLMEGPLSSKPCTVISGSMQDELRDIMQQRQIACYFDNIYGSPDSKDDIFKRESENGQITLPAVYIGDSLYDYQMADKYGLDFIFASHWTEFSDWQAFFTDKDVLVIKELADLLSI